MADVWRLIVDGPVDGALNMALDRAAQLAREEGSAPPTLRLYRWARPTVTLGRFQAEGATDSEWCAAYGVDVVRRATGGRAVLHDDEVTYSLIASVEDGMPRGVAASYRYLSAALAAAYRALGIGADITYHDRVSSASVACYLATTRADLSFGALKLSGSAQVWKGATVLQHGSFTRSRDVQRESRVFKLTAEEAGRLESETVTMTTALTTVPSIEEIERAIADAFRAQLGVVLQPGEWTPREACLAADLLRQSPDMRSDRADRAV